MPHENPVSILKKPSSRTTAASMKRPAAATPLAPKKVAKTPPAPKKATIGRGRSGDELRK
eukprot:1366179-Alexandrium_andersonii.AAC.1